jgi:SAM-dependent methyltransferase
MGIEDRWNEACGATIGTDLFWRIAVDHLSIERQLRPLIDRYARGLVLDAGAGRLAWAAQLRQRAAAYLPTDHSATHRDLAFCADLQGRLPLADGCLDTVFCCSVMEHAPEPWRILPEFHRVLRPGGHVILSVPFLYYLHGAPDDYYRFTKFGIVRLARAAGFDVVEEQVGGGFAHAGLHGLSMCITALLWTPRHPWLVTAPARGLFWLARCVDRLDRGRLFAQTVNVVLHRG